MKIAKMGIPCRVAVVHALSAIAIIPTQSGCKGDTGTDDDSGLSDGGDDESTGSYPDCPTCIGLGLQSFDCGCNPISDLDGMVCAQNYTDAENQCEMECASIEPTPTPCADNANSGSCTGWSPQSNITLTGGKRYVGASWLAGVIANSAPLWTCDDAYLEPVAGGKFKIKQANSGEALYELGLRNDDIPQTLNGMPLRDYEDVSQAFDHFWIDSGEDDYTLVVQRSGSNITLLYKVQ
jgi:hypothetical protein